VELPRSPIWRKKEKREEGKGTKREREMDGRGRDKITWA